MPLRKSKSDASVVAEPLAAEPNPDRRHRWFLSAILVLAALLRLYNLGGPSLWFDEVLTVSLSSEPLPRIPEVVRRAEQTPPMWHVLMHWWLGNAGLSEFAVRFPAAAFGTASVGVIYLLGASLYGRREGLVAALLMAVSPFQITYSQEARVYSLLPLLALLSCLAFVKMIRAGGTEPQVGYVLATGLLYWTHLHAVFVVAAQQVAWFYLMLSRSRELEPPRITTARWLLLSTASLALFAPWMPTVWGWLRGVSGGFWIPAMDAAFLPRTYALYAGGAVALVILLALSVWGVAQTSRKWAAVLLVSLALLPVLIPYAASLALRPLFVHRYAIAASVGLFLLAGRGLTALPRRRVATALLVVLVGLSAVAIPGMPDRIHHKADVRGSTEYVLLNARQGDVVFVNANLSNNTLLHYLNRRDLNDFQLAMSPAELVRPTAVATGASAWAITLESQGRPPESAAPTVTAWGWRLAESKLFDGVLVEQFVAPTDRPSTAPK